MTPATSRATSSALVELLARPPRWSRSPAPGAAPSRGSPTTVARAAARRARRSSTTRSCAAPTCAAATGRAPPSAGRASAARVPTPRTTRSPRWRRAARWSGVITQNVDRLHAAAGSRRVVELHGALEDVRCLACGTLEARTDVHERLLDENPGWLERVSGEVRPDGDADLARRADRGSARGRLPGRAAACSSPTWCSSAATSAEATLAAAWKLFDEAEALLVVGSSLAVWSGYRFVRRATERGVPVAIVNLGPTRADAEAALRVAARAGEVLPALRERAGPAGEDRPQSRARSAHVVGTPTARSGSARSASAGGAATCRRGARRAPRPRARWECAARCTAARGRGHRRAPPAPRRESRTA